MFRPEYVAIDFETNGLEWYREDFRIESMAASWRDEKGDIKSLFLVGEKDVAMYLILKLGNTPLIVHNAQFEIGTIMNRVKSYSPNILCDTMRLTQVTIGPGEGATQGYSLVNCIKRVLHPKYHNHKDKFYDWIVENKGCSRKEAGKYLSELPPDMLREYNILDTELTLRLYERLKDYAAEIHYDWKLDHLLYLNSCRLLAQAKTRGIKVDVDKLRDVVNDKQIEIARTYSDFRKTYEPEIREIEKVKEESWINGLKSEKGREKRRALLSDPETREKHGLDFNIGSAKDKEALFIDRLGMEVKFKTPGGSPSFKSSHLGSYGDGGKKLAKVGSIKITQNQAESLIDLASYDDRWHLDLKPTGTNTGRLSGGKDDHS